MTQRQRRPRRNHQRRIGFESLECRQVLTADFGDVGPDLWAWDAGAESADISAESWFASDSWFDGSGWVDDSSWVDDTSWNDEGSWSNDDSWVTANWSGDDAAVGTDVVTAVKDVGPDDGGGLQTVTTVEADQTVTDGGAVSEWQAFAPEATPGTESASGLEAFIVSLKPLDVSAETFTPVEPSSEPVIQVLRETVSAGVTDVTVTAEPSAGDQDAAVIDELSSDVILEGVDPAPEALDDSAFSDFDDPVADFDDPVAGFDDPVAGFDDPVAMVATTTVPPRQTPVQAGGVAGRFASWFGMFMQRYGGVSGSSDAASLADSEIPGRGRRGRLPFRPAD